MNGSARSDEDGLIARHFAPLAGLGAEGLQDDAAWLQPSAGHDLVLTTDAIVAGIHFFPDDPAGSIARKALGVNASDLAAKGARPAGFLLTLALPDDWTEPWLAAFAKGLGEAADAFGLPLLGGDTVRSAGPLQVGVTAFGEVPTGSRLRRKAALAGDLVCVTGTIGDGALGLRLRLEPQAAWAKALPTAAHEELADRYLHPRPRLRLAEALRTHASAAMDVSDGLVGDLTKMLAGTGLTAAVELATVPLSDATRHAIAAEPSLLTTALTGGDDYEILFTVQPERFAEVRRQADAAALPVTAIGRVTTGTVPPAFRAPNGAYQYFPARSFSHF